jgi:hypothetical protein
MAALAMLFVGFVFLTSSLVMPVRAVLVLLALWAVLAWYGFRLARRRSYLVLAVPVVATAIWVLALWLGDTLLGWTA